MDIVKINLRCDEYNDYKILKIIRISEQNSALIGRDYNDLVFVSIISNECKVLASVALRRYYCPDEEVKVYCYKPNRLVVHQYAYRNNFYFLRFFPERLEIIVSQTEELLKNNFSYLSNNNTN